LGEAQKKKKRNSNVGGSTKKKKEKKKNFQPLSERLMPFTKIPILGRLELPQFPDFPLQFL
jgi:hypothetical protein